MFNIVATYTLVAGGMSTRLPGDRVTMVSCDSREAALSRFPDIRDSMTVLPAKITIEEA